METPHFRPITSIQTRDCVCPHSSPQHKVATFYAIHILGPPQSILCRGMCGAGYRSLGVPQPWGAAALHSPRALPVSVQRLVPQSFPLFLEVLSDHRRLGSSRSSMLLLLVRVTSCNMFLGSKQINNNNNKSF